MSPPEPVPFRLPVPGRDSMDFLDGIQSVSYRMEGFVHLKNGLLSIEWTGTLHTEQVSFSGVRDEVEPLPVDWLEVPADWISEVRVTGGWWRPRLELRASRLEAFADVPGARPGYVKLKIRRRDRDLARRMAAAVERARVEASPWDRRQVRGGDQAPLLEDGG